MNFSVLASWAQNPQLAESVHFDNVCRGHFNLSSHDAAVLRDIALRSENAVLIAKQCTAYDDQEDRVMQYPTNVWTRDDVLHGYDLLAPVFQKLIALDKLEASLTEKAEAVVEWQSLRERCNDFSEAMPSDIREVIETTVEYGLRLFTATTAAWKLLGECYSSVQAGSLMVDPEQVRRGLDDFDNSWQHYQSLPEEMKLSPTLFRGVGWHFPGVESPVGLLASINGIRDLLA